MIVAMIDTLATWYAVGFAAGIGWGAILYERFGHLLRRNDPPQKPRPYDHKRDSWL